MRYSRVFLWLFIFIAVTLLFNLQFTFVYSPAGHTGYLEPSNKLLSIIYTVAWVILSIISGAKGKKEILLTALIYSLLPVLGLLIGGMFVMIFFYWLVPLQGLINHSSITFTIIMVLQPLLFVGGYYLGRFVSRSRNARV